MLVLALYMALLAGLAGLILWHGFNHTALLQATGGPILYFVPLFAGPLLLLLLLKPLFARPHQPPPARAIDHTAHPRLFQLLGSICQEVGTLPPSRVEVDASVNASVRFRRGWASLREQDLVLRIGLPLAAALSTRELGGVIAHEFGHFRQGAGLRLSFVVRRLSFWFWRVVHERDQIDEQLDAAIEDSPSAVVLVFLTPAAFGFRMARHFLHLLMLIAHAASCRLLRQMELDADLQEIRLAGSDAFHSTLRRTRLLGVAHQSIQFLLARAWRERQLPDNLPEFIRHTADSFPQERIDAIESAAAAATTGFFDTHPSDTEREAAAIAAAEPGFIGGDEPASTLFNDFPLLCREVTHDFYHDLLGAPPEPGRMATVETATGAHDLETVGIRHLERYAPGAGPYWSPIPWDPAALSDPTPVSELHAAIASSRVLIDDAPPGADLVHARREALALSFRLFAAEQLDAARIRWEAGLLQLSSNDPAALAVMREECDRRLAGCDTRFQSLLPAISSRLRAGLQLWWHDPNVANDPVAALQRDRIARFLPVLIHVGGIAKALEDLERVHSALHEVFVLRDRSRDPEALDSVVDQLTRVIRGRLREILPRMAGVPHPFLPESERFTTVRDLILRESHGGGGLEGTLSETAAIRSLVPPLYPRCLAALSIAASEAERKAGIA